MHSQTVANAYTQVLMACYHREARLDHIDEITLLANKLIGLLPQNPSHIHELAPILIDLYTDSKSDPLRESIIEFLNILKEALEHDDSIVVVIDSALAKCGEVLLASSDVSLEDISKAKEYFKDYASHTDDVDSSAYQDRHIDLLIQGAGIKYKQGQHQAAFDDYAEAYQLSQSPHALSQMAMIEAERANSQKALEYYQLLQTHIDELTFELKHQALTELHHMYDEFIPSDSRRHMIGEIAAIILTNVIAGSSDEINSIKLLDDFDKFTEMSNHDSFYTERLREIRDDIAPHEEKRLAEEKSQDDYVRAIQKVLQNTSLSSDHRLNVILGLEYENKDIVSQWIDSTLTFDEQNNVRLRNEAGIIKLIQRYNNLEAQFYLARSHELDNQDLAISFFTRIVMTADKDPKTVEFKKHARHFIENPTSTSRGLKDFFKPKRNNYADAMQRVILRGSASESPDASIRATLNELGKYIDLETYIRETNKVLAKRS